MPYKNKNKNLILIRIIIIIIVECIFIQSWMHSLYKVSQVTSPVSYRFLISLLDDHCLYISMLDDYNVHGKYFKSKCFYSKLIQLIRSKLHKEIKVSLS